MKGEGYGVEGEGGGEERPTEEGKEPRLAVAGFASEEQTGQLGASRP